MKKKLAIAPVRANVRGTWADHFTSRTACPPGATPDGSFTAITVVSRALPSSGAMKRLEAVRSVGPFGVIKVIDEMSTKVQSGGRRFDTAPASARSRMNVEEGSLHAFQ